MKIKEKHPCTKSCREAFTPINSALRSSSTVTIAALPALTVAAVVRSRCQHRDGDQVRVFSVVRKVAGVARTKADLLTPGL
jgi:hypothetical protein